MEDLTKFFASEDVNIDFRRAVPLLEGLHILFTRKVNYLLRDSSQVLKSMTDPITTLSVDGPNDDQQEEQEVPRAPAGTKRKAPNQNAGGRSYNNNANL